LSEHEITDEERDDHKQCETKHIMRVSSKKATIEECENPSEYRVKRFSERKYLVEGGDPKDSRSYKNEQIEATEYLCRYHFDAKYRYAETQIFTGNPPSDSDFMQEREAEYGRYTGKFTFRRMDGE